MWQVVDFIHGSFHSWLHVHARESSGVSSYDTVYEASIPYEGSKVNHCLSPYLPQRCLQQAPTTVTSQDKSMPNISPMSTLQIQKQFKV